MHKLSNLIISAIGLLSLTSFATAQTLISQWDFNAASSATNSSSGVVAGTSSGFSFPFSSALPDGDGSSRDPGTVISAGLNNQDGNRSGPQPNANGGSSGSNIAQWNITPGGTFTDIVMSWDMISTGQMSKFYQISVSLDGSPFVAPAGTGSTVSEIGIGTATIDNSGLITLDLDAGFVLNLSADPVSPIQYLELLNYSFSAIYDNATSLSVQIAAVHDTVAGDYVAASDGTVGSFNRTGGTKYDLVTFTGVPEPSTIAAVMGAIALGLVMYRRRR
jgi:hypothetical protein